MKRTLAAGLAALALSACQPHTTSAPSGASSSPSVQIDLSTVADGQSYAAAREKIEALNLAPTNVRHGDTSACVGSDAICRQFPEIIDCPGTGENVCRAAFVAPDGRYVVAAVAGEDPAHMTLNTIGWASTTDTRQIKNLLAGKPEDTGDDETRAEASAAPMPKEDQANYAQMMSGRCSVGLEMVGSENGVTHDQLRKYAHEMVDPYPAFRKADPVAAKYLETCISNTANDMQRLGLN